MTKCKSVTEADRIQSKTTLQTRESVNTGPCMRLQAAPLSLRYSLGLKWEVGPVLTAARPGQACVCTPTPAELKVKQWEQMLAASSVQLKSKRGTFKYHFTPVNKQMISTGLIVASHACSLLWYVLSWPLSLFLSWWSLYSRCCFSSSCSWRCCSIFLWCSRSSCWCLSASKSCWCWWRGRQWCSANEQAFLTPKQMDTVVLMLLLWCWESCRDWSCW